MAYVSSSRVPPASFVFVLGIVYLSVLFQQVAVPTVRAATAIVCPAHWIGDGWCDHLECNHQEQDWDGGDCCEETCTEDRKFQCGNRASYNCQDPEVLGTTMSYELTKQYTGFALTFRCNKTINAGYTLRYAYPLFPDPGIDLKRKSRSRYKKDPTVPDECQRNSNQSFRISTLNCDNNNNVQKNPECFDQGHIVMAQHMNDDVITQTEADFGTNIVPQVSGFNQVGVWSATEDLIEYHRDCPGVQRLEIVGGFLYDDARNDYFVDSHGIKTPDRHYRVVTKYFTSAQQKPPEVIAWVMQNAIEEDTSATQNMKLTQKKKVYLDRDLVTVEELKTIIMINDNDYDIDVHLPAEYTQTAADAHTSWDVSTCGL